MGRGYSKIVDITDHGPYVTKLVLSMPSSVNAEAVEPACFNVYVERKDRRGEILQLPTSWFDRTTTEPSKGYCEIRAAYPSDSRGERREESDFVTLELKIGPLFPLTAAIACPHNFNEFIVSDYRIVQLAEIPAAGGKLTGLLFDLCTGQAMEQAELFRHGISTYEEEPLKYGYYVPQTGGGKRPLLIWLHGAGEGGQDPMIAYAGNKVVNLASDEIQAKFGGAFILAPQTPTFWMNDGSGQYGRSGKSIYGKALKALIDEFIVRNEAAIDTDRIYIGGCSNGGFMTMRMALDYPDFFAAAYPVCEALYDETIADAEIEAIRHLPIWFTHAKDDSVVDPEETVVPTYRRLLAAGAGNVHLSLFDHVVDLHGLFKDEKGEPYTYFGHFAWIYALNDDCRLDYDGQPVRADGRDVSLMEWLALQRRSAPAAN